MTDPIPVHPRESDNDTLSIECSFRLKILDAATGEPVTDAYAISPTVDQSILDRRGVHPFRILNNRSITITHGQMADFSFDTKTLRTWKPGDSSSAGNKSLSSTWTCVNEFFHSSDPPETFTNADATAVFERVDGQNESYVCISSNGTDYARRSLVSNRHGILEVPIPLTEWITGTTIKIKLRDHTMLVAEDSRDPEQLQASETAAGRDSSTNGHKALGVELRNQPTGNEWWSKIGADEKQFQQEIEFQTSPLDWDNIDATVWVVKRIQEASVLVGNDLLPTPTSSYSGPSGVVIHYNSGYFMSEKRGAATRLCREAFSAGENDYMMRTEMALWILKRINGNSGSLGYHYHIDNRGFIYRSRDDSRRANHAGHSREPTTLTARQNDTENPATLSHTNNSPKSYLNSKYIGIDLLGNHREGYHFTDQQRWYLDRLIENIRSRHTAIHWYNIVGHDEIREAWNTANPNNTKAAKADPGAALTGDAQGMELLRGRHGANFN